jgi:hypothetical protein
MFFQSWEKSWFSDPLGFLGSSWKSRCSLHNLVVLAVLVLFWAVLRERPQNDQSLMFLKWFPKYAPWCITCPLIFTLCVASRSNFQGSCPFFQRVVLILPGGITQLFCKKECTMVHSFLRRGFLLVDEPFHSAVIKDVPALACLGLHFIQLI